MKANTPIKRMLDAITWTDGPKPTAHERDLPYATHEGWFEPVPGLRLRVYELNTGERVIDKESLQRFLAWLMGEEVKS